VEGDVLTEGQRRQFAGQGYVVLRNVLPDEVLAPVRRAMARVVDQQARTWLAEGRIRDLCQDLPFETRYAALRAQAPPAFSNIWRTVLVCPEVYAVWRRPELLGPVRSLVGDEVYAHGTWVGRPRAPNQPAMTVLWHQDAHYYQDWSPADGPMVTCWIPLVPVDRRSGCLEVVAASHHAGHLPPITTADGQQ
jgi:ectoine hydroxylase-related dioxygenase (phytanoyl-CoA dioxygenase family)